MTNLKEGVGAKRETDIRETHSRGNFKGEEEVKIAPEKKPLGGNESKKNLSLGTVTEVQEGDKNKGRVRKKGGTDAIGN